MLQRGCSRFGAMLLHSQPPKASKVPQFPLSALPGVLELLTQGVLWEGKLIAARSPAHRFWGSTKGNPAAPAEFCTTNPNGVGGRELQTGEKPSPCLWKARG